MDSLFFLSSSEGTFFMRSFAHAEKVAAKNMAIGNKTNPNTYLTKSRKTERVARIRNFGMC